jgi:hypothetical protein
MEHRHEFQQKLQKLISLPGGLEQPGAMDLLLVYLLEHDEKSSQTAIDLFWRLYKLEEGKIPLSKEIEDVMLESLGKLESATRVLYEPDMEEDYDKLHIYLHIAACRALLLRKRDGYSDDVRQTLEEAQRAARRFMGGETFPPDIGTESDWGRSAVAVTSLILVELFRVRHIDGNYEEALHLFALALGYASEALFAAFGDDPTEYWTPKYERFLPIINIDAQEAVGVFENLLASTRAKNWRQIADDCRIINANWGNCLGSNRGFRSNEEAVSDSEGREWDWLSFWAHAVGLAEANLEPSELREILIQEECESAEKRLQRYFFPDLWDQLPKEAQTSLVEADRMFHSRKGRVEAIFNELRLAVEAILRPMLWEPFNN